MKATIALLPGDGIGPEVCAEAVRALDAVATAFGHRFQIDAGLVGGAAIDASGDPLPPATIALCERADAVLLGAVGGPQWSDPNAAVRPEQGLLKLRATLGVYANLRPVKPHPAGAKHSPLKAAVLRDVDILFVRELTGGSYFGAKRREGDAAFDECRYDVVEIERATRRAGALARERRGKLTHVDKANVLETSRLWRATVSRVMREEFPEVALEHVLVDAMAMHLLTRPSAFDVILTENLFGDILTDEGSMLPGSMGLLPSASIGESGPGLYEPIHGSAPDIAGKGVANPLATILAAAMLLRHSLKREEEAATIEQAVERVLNAGHRTKDIARGGPSVGTTEMGRLVVEAIGR
jgi:3-isopropylmalate dehydrogenase